MPKADAPRQARRHRTAARGEPLPCAANAVSDAGDVSSKGPRLEPVEENQEASARANLQRGQRERGCVKTCVEVCKNVQGT
jgi:hypothetical protein